MAAPVENDPFGSDDLFAEFQRPVEFAGGADVDEVVLNCKSKTAVDAKSGRKHIVFEDSSSNSESENGDAEESNGASISPSIPSDDKSNDVKNHSSHGQNGSNDSEVIRVDPACCVQITYLDKQFATQHKDSIDEYIMNLIQNTENKKPVTDGDGKKFRECFHFYRDFLVDSKGNKEQFTNLLENSRPVYEQVYRKALPCESESEEEDEDACPQTRGNQRKSSCWNCGGSHNLSECKQEKNFANIQKNRAAFMSAGNNSQSNAKITDYRYHADDDPRFKDFKPGRISDSLRDALGIDNSEMPSYIYNMRSHGYPPGHFIEASLSATDIAMFDKHGREVSKEGSSMEDGEVDEQAAKGGYDYNKIIEYRGFNVAPDKTTSDYQQPPMNEFQLKVNLPVIFGSGVFRKIDGLERDATKHKLASRVEEDMDLGGDGCVDSAIDESSGTETPTQTLEDLELEKQRILQSLDGAESTDVDSTEVDTTIPDSSDAESVHQQANALVTPTLGRSRSVLLNLGTPIGVDSEQELPDPEKFRQNITEHIPYENLPNATGMFSKMMSVVGKVRESINQIKSSSK